MIIYNKRIIWIIIKYLKYSQSDNQSIAMIFDSLFPDDLEFKPVKGTSLEEKTPEDCDIFSNLDIKS